jgi:hypothetical protein
MILFPGTYSDVIGLAEIRHFSDQQFECDGCDSKITPHGRHSREVEMRIHPD